MEGELMRDQLFPFLTPSYHAAGNQGLLFPLSTCREGKGAGEEADLTVVETDRGHHFSYQVSLFLPSVVEDPAISSASPQLFLLFPFQILMRGESLVPPQVMRGS